MKDYCNLLNNYFVPIVLDVLVELPALLELGEGEADDGDEEQEEGVDAPLDHDQGLGVADHEGGEAVRHDVGLGEGQAERGAHREDDLGHHEGNVQAADPVLREDHYHIVNKGKQVRTHPV